jgi:hypothetical protein
MVRCIQVTVDHIPNGWAGVAAAASLALQWRHFQNTRRSAAHNVKKILWQEARVCVWLRLSPPPPPFPVTSPPPFPKSPSLCACSSAPESSKHFSFSSPPILYSHTMGTGAFDTPLQVPAHQVPRCVRILAPVKSRWPPAGHSLAQSTDHAPPPDCVRPWPERGPHGLHHC